MSNDTWRTPDWLFNWLNHRYGPFDIDLAADKYNHKCGDYFSLEDSALTKHNWILFHSPTVITRAFCNPPYSNLQPWLEKAYAERLNNVASTWVLPSYNGELHWSKTVIAGASEITHIIGRVAFLDTLGTPIAGNRNGTCIVHFEPGTRPEPIKTLYALRKGLETQWRK